MYMEHPFDADDITILFILGMLSTKISHPDRDSENVFIFSQRENYSIVNAGNLFSI